MKKILLTFCAFIFCVVAVAQKKNASFKLHINSTTESINIDGIADELVWKKAEVANGFHMVLPMDTSMAKVKTEVSMTYDKKNLYLLAICYKLLPGPDMVESLRRDFTFQKNDNFIMFMDTFEDQTNGFAFGANAAGAQWDGLIYEGGKVDLNWENKWVSAVKDYQDRWVLEMAIPFKTLRYKNGISNWGINFSRNDLKTTEKSSWAPIPRQFPTASLAYTGVLAWDAPLPAQGENISLIPYFLAGNSKSYYPALPKDFKTQVGLDARIAVTSSLSLDLTVNPDFSQVEADKQITNLDRYELFYPERRQFFLENGDQINNFGYPALRPFFSRRIGLGVPIKYGGRLSGKLNRSWRITAMDMQTSEQEKIRLPGQNFSVMALQKKIFSRSNIGLIFVNMQSNNQHPEKDSTLPAYSLYNRNIGVEYNLASSNNLWTGKLMALKSFSPAKSGNDFVHAGNLQYAGKRWLINGAYESTGKNYTAEVGYIPRKDYIRLNPQIAYTFFPRKGNVLTHGPQLNMSYYYNKSFNKTDYENTLSYLVTFRNKATLAPVIMDDYVKLLFRFDPTNSGKDSLKTGSEHHWKTIGVDFISQPQKLFTYGVAVRTGGYYNNGNRVSLSGSLGYRFQPFVNITVTATYNKLSLPAPWNQNTFWLVSPKVDLTLTNKLYFTAYLQYNEQLKNTNLNARLQWRYKPASDLFLVYTDNYLNAPFFIRNRFISLKFNYWWNL